MSARGRWAQARGRSQQVEGAPAWNCPFSCRRVCDESGAGCRQVQALKKAADWGMGVLAISKDGPGT